MRNNRYRFVAPCVLGLVVLGLAAAALGAQSEISAQAATKPSTAPDFQTIARMIVNDSVQVKEKEGVLISGDSSKIPLMEAIAVEVAKKGAFPHMVLVSPVVEKRILTEAPMQFLETPNPMTLAEVKKIDVMIGLSAVQDPAYLAKAPEERVALTRKAAQAINDVLYARPIRSVALGNPIMPTPETARYYGIPMTDFEARFWQAVQTPHAAIAENADKVQQILASGREIRIKTQAGTDLRLKLAGRKIGISDGRIRATPVDRPEQVWLPAGEVYTTPDAVSVNGTVIVPMAEYRGIKIKNLRLTFENGKVTQIQAAQNAEALKEALAKSSGDKDLFSFLDIGVNPNSHQIKGFDYSTFEMAGMVTIGIGQAPWADSSNKSEFAQDFFLPRATLEVDGKTIVKEGELSI
jgi:leucyl aminopeptidase (aminopeptidase T)